MPMSVKLEFVGGLIWPNASCPQHWTWPSAVSPQAYPLLVVMSEKIASVDGVLPPLELLPQQATVLSVAESASVISSRCNS